jgi:hypothetical protein
MRSAPATPWSRLNYLDNLVGAHASLEQIPFQIGFGAAAVDGIDDNPAGHYERQQNKKGRHYNHVRVRQ